MIKLMVVGFCFIRGWCSSEWWGWDSITLAQFQGSEMSPRPYGWVHKTLRLSSLVIEHSVVVANFWFPFCKVCVQNQWGMGGTKFWDPVEDSDTGGTSSINVRMEYVLAFQYWYCELCVENQWGGGRKHCFVNFCSLAVLELSVDEGWWGGAESLI